MMAWTLLLDRYLVRLPAPWSSPCRGTISCRPTQVDLCLLSANIAQLTGFFFRCPLSHWVSWIFKGSVTPLSEQHLQATTNQDSNLQRNQSVVFTVVIPPKLGQLVQRLPDNSTKKVSTFTQSMVGPSRSVATWSHFLWQKGNFSSFLCPLRWTRELSCTIRRCQSLWAGRQRTPLPSLSRPLLHSFLCIPSPFWFPTRPANITEAHIQGPGSWATKVWCSSSTYFFNVKNLDYD